MSKPRNYIKIMEGIVCPKCKGPITYNGNYFCVKWEYPYTGERDTCDWALSHPPETYEDRLIEWKLCGYWVESEDPENGDAIVRTRPKRDDEDAAHF